MKNWLPALVVVFSITTASADQRIAKWDWFASGEGSAALDCQNCPEDEYIRFFCPMNSRQVEVSMPGVVLPEGIADRTPIFVELNIDGEVSKHPGTVAFSAMFGSLGSMSLRKDDPVFERLKAGTHLKIAIEGASVDVPLTGSKAAIENLLVGCS